MSIAIGSDKVKMASNVSCFIILEKTKRKYKLSVSITIANWGCTPDREIRPTLRIASFVVLVILYSEFSGYTTVFSLWVNLRYGVYG